MIFCLFFNNNNKFNNNNNYFYYNNQKLFQHYIIIISCHIHDEHTAMGVAGGCKGVFYSLGREGGGCGGWGVGTPRQGFALAKNFEKVLSYMPSE